MSSITDQSRDINGQELYRIFSQYPLPVFVKNASQSEICGEENLPPHLFADRTHRLFPIHTGPATLVSSIFFNEKRAEMRPHAAEVIDENLKKAAEYFNVSGYMRTLSKRAEDLAADPIQAVADSDFAIVFKRQDGETERRYPLRNAGEVKVAAAWLMKNRSELPFEDRRHIATKILEKSAKYGVGLADTRYELEKTAGLGTCAGGDVAALIRTRIRATGWSNRPNPMQQELEKLASICELRPEDTRHPSMRFKIAELIDDFDRQHGLHNRYDDIIQRPEDVLFAITEKSAAALEEKFIGSPLTGNYYKRADLQRVPVTEFADSLGDDFAKAISTAGVLMDLEKAAQVIPTLPLGDAELFDEIISASGIVPVITKSAAIGRAITPEVQDEIAKVHKPTPGSLWGAIG